MRNEIQLKELVTNFNVTMAALASESGNLRTSIRELAPTLENANAAFASLNAAVPVDARVRARDPARRARDAGDDRRGVPVDPRRRAG